MRGWRREDGWKHQLDYLGPKYIEISSDMTRNHKKSALSDERKVWQRKESKGQQAFRSGSSAISRQLFTLHFPERASCYFIPLSPDRLFCQFPRPCLKSRRVDPCKQCLWYSILSFPEEEKRKRKPRGTSLVVQWLWLNVPNAGGPDLIPNQGTRSHTPQLRVCMLQLKYPTYCN